MFIASNVIQINTAPDVTETESQDKVPLTVHNGEEKKPRDSHASDSGISAEYGELFKTGNLDAPLNSSQKRNAYKF